MDKKLRSKLLALIGYSFGMIFLQRFFMSDLSDWVRVLLGIFFLLMIIFQGLILLDIEIRIPISRRWYYILLTGLTVGILILLVSLLWY